MPAADLAVLVSRFGARLHAAGLPVGPERLARFARAITLVDPVGTPELFRCARVTLLSDPGQVDLLAQVFHRVFGGSEGGLADPADGRGDLTGPPPVQALAPEVGLAGSAMAAPEVPTDRSVPPGQAPVRAMATAVERLAARDFAELTAAELLELAELMRRLTIATPMRPARRFRAGAGDRIDLRGSLRAATRTGGDPVRLARRRRVSKPRRLVVLCDISGSMEPYARAMIQLVYCAAGAARAEVFTFATRLTRVTRVLRHRRPADALAQAGRLAPDWSGGTRIAEAVREFIDRYGRQGMARGAVVLIVSDGWETGDPAELGRQLARLSRLAYRIVWANPRTQSSRYEPLVGGMAAAWPYCDVVVSAHRLAALDELTAALSER
jgi:uncharacterized protein with von Willebrand factor type A (vWA) domain